MKTLIYLFIVLFVSVDARLFEGQCRERPTTVKFPFFYESYLGVWYEVGHREYILSYLLFFETLSLD